MALSFFPVQAKLYAVVTDSSGDVGGDPDIKFISSTVTFTPSVDQVASAQDGVIYKLTPVQGRTNSDDGSLVTVDGSELSLPANDSALALDELRYKVEFTNVQGGTHELHSFTFVAPTDSTTVVDLTTVDRL